MKQYRIVSRPSHLSSDTVWYHAQYKFLNLFWTDCEPDPCCHGYPCSTDLSDVELFIDYKIRHENSSEDFIKEPLRDLSQKVIRTYNGDN